MSTPLPDNVKRNRRLSWPATLGGVFLLALYLLAFVFSDRLENKGPVETRSYQGLSYDSRSPDIAKSTMKELNQGGEAELRQMTMAFRMKVHSIDKHSDLFQTAPGNSGIRMELRQPSLAALILTSRTWLGTDMQVVLLTSSVILNRWYSVLITLDPKHHLKVWLNNLLVVDVTDDTWVYKASDIAVGTGFSKTRPFDGEIANCSMQFALQPKKHLVSLLLSGARALLVALFFMAMTLLCFYFIRTYGPRLTAKLDLSFLSYPRIATLENILLFHFFVCSLALVWFTKRAAGLAYVIFPGGPLPNYNEWVLPLVFTGKTRELATYLAGVAVLFLYYSAVYFLLRRPPRILSERFYVLVCKTRERFLGYLFTVAIANLLVARLDRVIKAPALQVALWLCVFLIPFYLHIGGTPPNRRPTEAA